MRVAYVDAIEELTQQVQAVSPRTEAAFVREAAIALVDHGLRDWHLLWGLEVERVASWVYSTVAQQLLRRMCQRAAEAGEHKMRQRLAVKEAEQALLEKSLATQAMEQPAVKWAPAPQLSPGPEGVPPSAAVAVHAVGAVPMAGLRAASSCC